MVIPPNTRWQMSVASQKSFAAAAEFQNNPGFGRWKISPFPFAMFANDMVVSATEMEEL